MLTVVDEVGGQWRSGRRNAIAIGIGDQVARLAEQLVGVVIRARDRVAQGIASQLEVSALVVLERGGAVGTIRVLDDARDIAVRVIAVASLQARTVDGGAEYGNEPALGVTAVRGDLAQRIL